MKITKDILKQDPRFYVDERNLDRLTQRRILRYDIQKMKVGMILRAVPDSNRIVTLDKTRVYAYLTNTDNGDKQYDEYVKFCNASFRNREAYDKLIDDMTNNPYDILRGAIVINQDNIICDGQHRCCFLLYKYGPNYKVDVLKIQYGVDGYFVSRMLFKLRLIFAEIRACFLCFCYNKRSV